MPRLRMRNEDAFRRADQEDHHRYPEGGKGAVGGTLSGEALG